MRELKNQKGIALVTALWLLVILVVLVSEMVVNTKSDVLVVRNFKEDREAYFLAYSGLQMGLREIASQSDFHYAGKEGVVFGLAGEEIIDKEIQYRTGIPLGQGKVSYFIDDENRKLNINDIAKDPLKLGRFVEFILRESEEDIVTIIDSITDWVDADDYHHANGAESDYYETLTPPYSSKDGDFDSIKELKLVKGITPTAYRLLAENLTIYKTRWVNRNTASPAVLYADGLTESEVEEVLLARDDGIVIDHSVKSEIFTILSTGSLTGSKTTHQIEAVALRTGLQTLLLLDWKDNYYEGAVKIGSE